MGPYATPPAYRQFFLDRDEEIVFVMQLDHYGPAFTLVGQLHRPDGVAARDFRHDVAASPPGSSRTYYQTARFSVAELRPYPGAWQLRLLVDGQLAGVYGFRLDDSTSVSALR